jgi:hypothetical protein
MANKTIFYVLAVLILFSSCASDEQVENQNNSSNSNQTGVPKIFLGTSKNAATRSASVASNSLQSENLSDSLNLFTNTTGDTWEQIGNTISNDTYPHSFIVTRSISNDFSAINFADSSGIIESYLVLSNDLAIALSNYGLPQNNTGNLKSSAKIYSRFDHYYYKANGNLIDLKINQSGDVSESTVSEDVQNFEILKNFIRYQKSDGHYIRKFSDNQTLKMSNLDWLFNSDIRNNYVFKMNEECLIVFTTNTSPGDEYNKFCMGEDGNYEITNARQGLRDCYSDNSITWCNATGSETQVLNTSLNNCSHLPIDDGFLVCNSSFATFWDLRNNTRDQLEKININFSQSSILNQYFTDDGTYVYMISGAENNIKFSKINLVDQTSILIDVSSYTKPNWIEYCDGVVDLSIDDKFLKYYPNTGNLVEIGSNEGLKEYECIE